MFSPYSYLVVFGWRKIAKLSVIIVQMTTHAVVIELDIAGIMISSALLINYLSLSKDGSIWVQKDFLESISIDQV